MKRWSEGISGCVWLLVCALGCALPAAAIVAPDCDGYCALAPCPGAGAGERQTLPALPSQKRPSPCPPWRDCTPAPGNADVFRRFDDTARERLRPMPAPPIRG